MTVCVKYCEHKAASWKLHMGCILEQAESGSGISKDSTEFKKRKKTPSNNNKIQKGSRKVCIFSLMKPFPGLAAGTGRTLKPLGSAYKFLMFSATPAVYCGSVWKQKKSSVRAFSLSPPVPHGSEIFFNTPRGTVSTSVSSSFTFMSPFIQLYCSPMLTGSKEPSSVVSVNQRHRTPKSIPKDTRSCTSSPCALLALLPLPPPSICTSFNFWAIYFFLPHTGLRPSEYSWQRIPCTLWWKRGVYLQVSNFRFILTLFFPKPVCSHNQRGNIWETKAISTVGCCLWVR